MKLYAALCLAVLMGALCPAWEESLDEAMAHATKGAALGQFDIKACALVDQAVWDAKGMSQRWYRIAAQVLRECGRINSAVLAERKAKE